MHSGGKKMQNFKALRARTWGVISLIAVIALVIGFTAIMLVSENRENNLDFGIAAEPVPDGILLTFSNIPEDTVRLFVHVSHWENEEYDSSRNINSSIADIRDISLATERHHSIQLDKLKKTEKLIIPIFDIGQKYWISATVYNKQEHELLMSDLYYWKPGIETELIADNGIYFNKDGINFELNNNNSTVSLSSGPMFSSDVVYCSQKFNFGIVIIVPEGSVSKWTHHIPEGLSSDGLNWTFEPRMSYEFQNVEYLKNGHYYTAWAIAEANIIYDDITWSIEIAKTPVFTYSL
jgi:hypothetical protein